MTNTGLAVTVVCGTGVSAGNYSQLLLYGDYWVEIPGIGRFLIQMPSGSGSYALESVDVDPASPLAYSRVYDTWAAFQLVTMPVTVEWVTLREDPNGAQHVLYFRSSHADVLVFTPDGVNVIGDASNNRFIRQGVDPDELV